MKLFCLTLMIILGYLNGFRSENEYAYFPEEENSGKEGNSGEPTDRSGEKGKHKLAS